MATAAERLATISAAIDALLNGGAASYSIGTRSVTKFDLGELLEWEQLLQTQVNRGAARSPFTLAKIGRTSR